MKYIHTDIYSSQCSKKPGDPCGDVYGFKHDIDSTTIILSDGLGSGIKANIAAQMCVSRFLGLIGSGATLREAFSLIVKTMNSAWGTNNPFAVFSVARILNNGNTTVLSYDSPPPILVSENHAFVLSDRVYTLGNAVISESSGTLTEKQGLILLSDGITQSGMGKGKKDGWESNGVSRFLSKNNELSYSNGQQLTDKILAQAKSYWGNAKGDDCSVLYAKNRKGITVNLLSGPPSNKNSDKLYITDFINSNGIQVICGGTTAKIASEILAKKLIVHNTNEIIPPSLKIEGIHLVTEGIVVLNQVNNLLDEEIEYSEQESPVFELYDLLYTADRINFFTGNASNLAGEHIKFRQQGILPRKKVLELIKEKLKQKGKLVVSYDY